MATSSKSGPQLFPPSVSAAQGAKLLRQLVKDTDPLFTSKGLLDANRYAAWELRAANVLEKAFGKHSPNIAAILDEGKYSYLGQTESEVEASARRTQTLQRQLAKLEGLTQVLDSEVELEEGQVIRPSAPTGHKVFLVHGRSELPIQEVARFMERLQQRVVILREQPNQGRTIIEKFEDEADVGYAVVLLTGDDVGGLAPGGDLVPRARQNVVFELGYFMGRLGRNRVCALVQPGVEVLSDFAGVVYIELDDKGAWRLMLARELKAAGLPVDMNLA